MAVTLLPIHTSTPLRTRKGTVSVYGEAYKGALIEPPRTNLVVSSNILVGLGWKNDGHLAITEESINKYKGYNSNKLAATTKTAAHLCYTNGTVTSGQTYTFSAAFKAGNHNYAQIVMGSAAFGGNAFAIIDLSDGTVGTVGSSVTSTVVENMGDGWYYFSVTAPATGSGTSAIAGVAIVPAKNSARLASFTGAGEFIYVFNVQPELGAFRTSPIITTATTVTRPAANLTRPTAGTALAALNNWGIRLRFRPTAAGQTAVLWGSYTDANNATHIDLTASTLTYTKRLAGSNHVAQASLTHAAATLYDVIIYQHSVSGMGITFRSWNGSAWSAWSAWATLTDANGIANAAIASTYQWGALNNASHVSANMPFCHVFELKAALAAQTEIADMLAKGRI